MWELGECGEREHCAGAVEGRPRQSGSFSFREHGREVLGTLGSCFHTFQRCVIASKVLDDCDYDYEYVNSFGGNPSRW